LIISRDSWLTEIWSMQARMRRIGLSSFASRTEQAALPATFRGAAADDSRCSSF